MHDFKTAAASAVVEQTASNVAHPQLSHQLLSCLPYWQLTLLFLQVCWHFSMELLSLVATFTTRRQYYGLRSRIGFVALGLMHAGM